MGCGSGYECILPVDVTNADGDSTLDGHAI